VQAKKNGGHRLKNQIDDFATPAALPLLRVILMFCTTPALPERTSLNGLWPGKR